MVVRSFPDMANSQGGFFFFPSLSRRLVTQPRTCPIRPGEATHSLYLLLKPLVASMSRLRPGHTHIHARRVVRVVLYPGHRLRRAVGLVVVDDGPVAAVVGGRLAEPALGVAAAAQPVDAGSLREAVRLRLLPAARLARDPAHQRPVEGDAGCHDGGGDLGREPDEHVGGSVYRAQAADGLVYGPPILV